MCRAIVSFRYIWMPRRRKKQHPACAVCSKAHVLFKLRWAPPGGFCFPIYGLAAATVGLAPGISQRQRAVIEHATNTAGCRGDTVDGPSPRSNRKRSIFCEFELAPASRQPQQQRGVDGDNPAGGPG